MRNVTTIDEVALIREIGEGRSLDQHEATRAADFAASTIFSPHAIARG